MAEGGLGQSSKFTGICEEMKKLGDFDRRRWVAKDVLRYCHKKFWKTRDD